MVGEIRLRRSALKAVRSSGIPQPHDPNVPGPFDVCLRCYRPYSQKRGYCLTCGRRWGFELIAKEHRGIACARHPSRSVGYCCLCGKPGCSVCIHVDKSGTDLYSGAKLHRCFECLIDSASREAKFLSRLMHQKSCVKHKTISWKFRCVSCSSPLCESCSYFNVTGVFRKKINGAPYCLPCFRSSSLFKKRGWVSGLTVKQRLGISNPSWDSGG